MGNRERGTVSARQPQYQSPIPDTYFSTGNPAAFHARQPPSSEMGLL